MKCRSVINTFLFPFLPSSLSPSPRPLILVPQNTTSPHHPHRTPPLYYPTPVPAPHPTTMQSAMHDVLTLASRNRGIDLEFGIWMCGLYEVRVMRGDGRWEMGEGRWEGGRVDGDSHSRLFFENRYTPRHRAENHHREGACGLLGNGTGTGTRTLQIVERLSTAALIDSEIVSVFLSESSESFPSTTSSPPFQLNSETLPPDNSLMLSPTHHFSVFLPSQQLQLQQPQQLQSTSRSDSSNLQTRFAIRNSCGNWPYTYTYMVQPPRPDERTNEIDSRVLECSGTDTTTAPVQYPELPYIQIGFNPDSLKV
ncbi:hypothetical protein EV368DRAFT_89607 [Lentinula lateritia]|nr:hypothetical protein EV368DRAFT_89607 [Lentinula lateritia]